MRVLIAAALMTGLCVGLTVTGEGRALARTPVPLEITHGVNAAAQCGSESWSTEDYSNCLDAAVAQAMDANSASMSFQLGVYCSGFYKLAQADRTQAWKQSAVHSDAADAATVDQFDSCVFAAGAIGLADARICTALGVSCQDFDPMLRYWQRVSGSRA
jgi:hypothetical protein